MIVVGVRLQLVQMVKLGRIAILLSVLLSTPLPTIAVADAPQSRRSTTHVVRSPLLQAAHGVGHGMAIWKSPKAKPWPTAWTMDMIVHRALGHVLSKLPAFNELVLI